MRPHLSLDVRHVGQSVEFYSRVFGVKPQKQTADYAKFDLHEPSLNFSMQSAAGGQPSRVSHLGIEVDSTEEVNRWRARLENQQVATRPEENVTCCHARQDKVWFEDPDGNAWEIFVVHEQLPIHESSQSMKGCCGGKK